ncbi:hypothetical protein SUGI_0466010 [Cryptomeria japonica]|uniref:beta-galactosidase 10 n=1 Tax=Cryptomeria japonica TaxID=3369 RepID=UPI002408C5E5|nr:beta-galactosidase 10 [Cryptomeria japonica]GLJ24400.1 hypothetical protein SUGI_0466010 [Cryptomeria japonica]
MATVAQRAPLVCLCALIIYAVVDLKWVYGANVSYDHRSLIIDGQRKLLMSASIHYPRSVPAMWPDLIAKAKEGGIDVIDTYVFWNGHEPKEGTYYFEDRFDLVKFVKIAQQAGLYVNLRIGPFIAAEWIFGGIPIWLHYVPGTVFRTNNEPFKRYMEKFTTYIVDLMKHEKLFASQGGPIILSQIENEYGDMESNYGEGAKPYAMWAAKMALSQNIGVPWIMCQQYDAPDPVINTCNQFYCDQFTPNSYSKPKMWTENWPGWFKTFGSRNPHRPPEDIAFGVARFFQKGGTYQNYYMYHGGTNFARTAGGPFITTSYDYDAPIDEFGLLRQPKWGHLKELHEAIKLCDSALLYGEEKNLSLGPLQEANVYTGQGVCAAFLSNSDEEHDKDVIFQNKSYHLPAWSVSILPDCKNVAFNTAKIGVQTSIVEMQSIDMMSANSLLEEESNAAIHWETFKEKVGVWGNDVFTTNTLIDQINTTKDTTDYLWYTTSLQVDEKEPFFSNGLLPVLIVESRGHAMHLFINNEFIGSASGNGDDITFKYEKAIHLRAGKNDIVFLSMTVGLQNGGPHYDFVGAGISKVKLEGFRDGSINLSTNDWTYQIGLKGEQLNLYLESGVGNVQWEKAASPPKNRALTWYKARINAPPGNDPVALDMLSMGKGQAWLNGRMIGRYWPISSSPFAGCPSKCNYRGKFLPNKCSTDCGNPTQRWYHVPRSWFNPTDNLLVLFEDKGGDPTQIRFVKREAIKLCGLISEAHPPHLKYWRKTITNSIELENTARPTLNLQCPEGSQISSINFASFGNPQGACGAFEKGSCHGVQSSSIVQKDCIGCKSCSVTLSVEKFGEDPCPGASKSLAVEAYCS